MKKKILSVVTAIVMILSVCMLFAACSGDSSEKAPDASLADASNADAANEGASSAEALVTAKEGVLTMATNAEFPPYEYRENDAVVGIDAEIAALIAEKLGLELEIVDVAFESIIPGVQSGKYDMGMAGMTVNEERLQSVDFSSSYATGVQVVIVPENSDIQSIDDLEGKKIGVQTTTTGDIYATDDYGEDAVTRYDNGAVAVQALLAGKVDCVIIDNEPAKSYVAANEGLKILETEYTVEDYAICFAKGNTALKDSVDAALKELIADGSVQAVLDKYITAE